MEQEFIVCYINPHYWYERYQQHYTPHVAIPTGATISDQEKKRKKSLVSKKWPIPVIVLSVLALVALAVGLYFILRPSTADTTDSAATTDAAATTDSTPTIVFWPYGAEVGDASFTAGGTSSYTPDEYITGGYNILSIVANGPASVELFCKDGKVVVTSTPLGCGTPILTVYSSKSLAPGYDDPDPSQERYCYHRMTSSNTDKDRICALIAGFPATRSYEAYVFTWVNYTYGGGTKIGTFQMILVFSHDHSYLIRMYNDIMHDITGVTEQFSVGHIVPTKSYEAATMAADVRGKLEVFDLAGSSTEPNLDDAAPGDGTSCN